MDPVGLSPAMLRLHKVFSNAAENTGVPFDFLLKTAARESGMHSSAQAKGSSAAGLFQFVEQTWLGMVSRHGAKYGLGKEATKITRNEDGKYQIADTATRNRVLGLRFDPKVSTDMAAELTAENKAQLAQGLGRQPTEAELYAAHFLGAGGALHLIKAAAANPNRLASLEFPAAAKANPAVFHDASGESRTLSGLLDELGRQHDDAAIEPQQADSNSPFSAGPSFVAAGKLAVRTAMPLRLSPMVVQLLAELSVPGGASKE